MNRMTGHSGDSDGSVTQMTRIARSLWWLRWLGFPSHRPARATPPSESTRAGRIAADTDTGPGAAAGTRARSSSRATRTGRCKGRGGAVGGRLQPGAARLLPRPRCGRLGAREHEPPCYGRWQGHEDRRHVTRTVTMSGDVSREPATCHEDRRRVTCAHRRWRHEAHARAQTAA